MPNEPEGKGQPSTAREEQQPSPEETLQLKELSLQRGQVREALAQTSAQPLPELAAVEQANEPAARTIDEVIALGMDRKMAEIINSAASSLPPGGTMDLEVAGHSIQINDAREMRIDGREATQEEMRRLAEQHHREIEEAVRREQERIQEAIKRRAADKNRQREAEGKYAAAEAARKAREAEERAQEQQQQARHRHGQEGPER